MTRLDAIFRLFLHCDEYVDKYSKMKSGRLEMDDEQTYHANETCGQAEGRFGV